MIAWTKETNLAWALINRQRYYDLGKLTNSTIPTAMYDNWVKALERELTLVESQKHKYQYDIQRHADLFMQKHINPKEI